MSIKHLKYIYLDKQSQVIVFDQQGSIMDSDETIVQVSNSDFNVFNDTMFCGMETEIGNLKSDEVLRFDCINTDLFGKTSVFDFIIEPLDNDVFALLVYDFGPQYEKVFELQQERNIAEIQVKKLERESRKLKEERDAVEKLYQGLSENDSVEFILIKSDSQLINVNLSDISYFEAFGDYIKVHTPDKVYISYNTMKKVESELPESKFFRIHRSYLVRLDKIKNIEQLSVEIGDAVLPIGKSYKTKLVEKMGQL